MGLVKGKGVVSHGFFGTYSGFIVLGFSNVESAKDALRVLGAPWEQGISKHTKEPVAALTWAGNSEELDALKRALKDKYHLKMVPCGMRGCRNQCRDAEIDNVNHSVDVGTPWTVEIEVVPSEQLALVD